MTSSSQMEYSWLLDSGAATHITVSKSILDNHIPYTAGEKVIKMANNSDVSIDGIGSMTFQFTIAKSRQLRFCLCDVLVARMGNIISIARFAKDNLSAVEFSKKTYVVRDEKTYLGNFEKDKDSFLAGGLMEYDSKKDCYFALLDKVSPATGEEEESAPIKKEKGSLKVESRSHEHFTLSSQEESQGEDDCSSPGTSSLEDEMTTWVLDSGASDHFTNDISMMDNPVEYKGGGVKMPDGSVLDILMIGSATFEIVSDFTNKSRKFILRDILYYPEAKNTISVARLTTDNSCSVEFSFRGYCIRDRLTFEQNFKKDKKVFLTAGRSSGYLYHATLARFSDNDASSHVSAKEKKIERESHEDDFHPEEKRKKSH